MKRKTEADLERSKIIKTYRTWIRLQHSIAAERELNEILPDTLEEFNAALARGELLTLNASLGDAVGMDNATDV